MKRECRICGQSFTPKKKNQVYCSYRCQREQVRRNSREYSRERRSGNRKPTKGKTLEEIAASAREEGLTYGAFVAKYGR